MKSMKKACGTWRRGLKGKLYEGEVDILKGYEDMRESEEGGIFGNSSFMFGSQV